MAHWHVTVWIRLVVNWILESSICFEADGLIQFDPSPVKGSCKVCLLGNVNPDYQSFVGDLHNFKILLIFHIEDIL